MSREDHVRFCERLGVKLPRPTRPTILVLTDVIPGGDYYSP